MDSADARFQSLHSQPDHRLSGAEDEERLIGWQGEKAPGTDEVGDQHGGSAHSMLPPHTADDHHLLATVQGTASEPRRKGEQW